MFYLIEVLEKGFIVIEVEPPEKAGPLEALAVLKQTGVKVRRFAAESEEELARIIGREVKPRPAEPPPA